MFDVNTFTWASVKLKCLVMFWITYFLPRLFLWFWNIVKVGYVSENRWLTIVRNDDECLWGRLTSNHPAHIWNSYLQRANFNMNIQRLLLTTTTRVHSFIFRLRIEEKLHNVGTLRPHKLTQTVNTWTWRQKSNTRLCKWPHGEVQSVHAGARHLLLSLPCSSPPMTYRVFETSGE